MSLGLSGSDNGNSYHDLFFPASKRRKLEDAEESDPSNMSIEKLEELLNLHREKCTLSGLLTYVKVGSTIFKKERRHDSMYDNHPDGNYSRLFGTPLHFACMDKDGRRGQAKIAMLLSKAKDLMIDIWLMLNVRTKSAVLQWDDSFKILNEGEGKEPMYYLLRNESATRESVRTICDAWPPTVHQSYERESTLYMACDFHWIRGELTDDFIARRLNIVKELLAASRKTKEGPRHLVLSENYFKWSFRPNSPLSVLTHTLAKPQQFISTLVQECPDALLYCKSGHCCARATSPFHNVVRLNVLGIKSHSARIQSILAFLKYSTTEAIAFALLYVDIQCDGVPHTEQTPESGFSLLLKALDHDESSLVENDIAEIFQIITKTCDRNGNTVFHHAAISVLELDPMHVAAERERILGRRDIIEDTGLDMNDGEMRELQQCISKWKEYKEKQLVRLFKWAHEKDQRLLTQLNNEQSTPLDLLLSTHYWTSGLKEIAHFAPHWPLTKSSGYNLYPFMIAASVPVKADLDTIYELLRFAPQCCTVARPL